jgi:hypothetical protein
VRRSSTAEKSNSESHVGSPNSLHHEPVLELELEREWVDILEDGAMEDAREDGAEVAEDDFSTIIIGLLLSWLDSNFSNFLSSSSICDRTRKRSPASSLGDLFDVLQS